MDNKQKCICFVALLLGVIGIVLPESTTSTTVIDCITNCTFNKIYVNELAKNDTTDSYGSSINLHAPLSNVTSDVENTIDIGGGEVTINSADLITSFSSIFSANPYEFILQVTNGVNSYLQIRNNSINIVANTTNYSFNNTELNMHYANLTNCFNCILIDNGSYIGDDTVNRFIPYTLGKTAKKIDIVSNLSPSTIGEIIVAGRIEDIKTGSSYGVTKQNNTGFFVSSVFNQKYTVFNLTEIGDTSSTGTTLLNYALYTPITPSTTGTLINISANIQTAVGSGKFALYNDSGGSPDTLINYSDNFTLVTGWNSKNIVANITSGTPYWLGMEISTNSGVVYRKLAGTLKYQTQAFGTFPTTASGLSNTTNTYNMKYAIYNISYITSYSWIAIG